MLSATVNRIAYDDLGVAVELKGGEVLRADYVLCTFSVGVLQNDDVAFEPELPGAYIFVAMRLRPTVSD